MSYSPFALKELRYVSAGSTFPTAFTAANDSTWTNAVKLRAFDIKTDIKYASQKDKTVQTRRDGHPASIPTIKSGSLEFSMHLEGGSATTGVPTVATLLSKVLGGLKSPTAISDAAEAASAIDFINATTHGMVAGQGVLVGVRGDGRAAGSLAAIKTIDNADKYSFHMALPGAPAALDVLKNGHAVYFDGSAENYLNFLLINHYPGSSATDDCDQINMIGCSGTVSFAGFKPGETPVATFKFNVGDHRNEPYATKASFQLTTSPSGNNPAGSQAIGAFCIGDASSYIRSAVAGGDIEVHPNITLEEIKNPAGANGCGGWISIPNETGPTCAITRYWGDMPGLYDDFVGGTAKQVLFQWGHEAQKTVGMFLQRCFFEGIPERVEFSKNTALKLTLHAESGGNTDESTDDYKLRDSPLIVFFN